MPNLAGQAQFNVRISEGLKGRLERLREQENLSYPELLAAMLNRWESGQAMTSQAAPLSEAARRANAMAVAESKAWAHSARPEPIPEEPFSEYEIESAAEMGWTAQQWRDHERALFKPSLLASTEPDPRLDKVSDAALDAMKRPMNPVRSAEDLRAELAQIKARESASSATPPSVETAGHPARGPGRMQQEDDAAGLKAALERATSASSTRSSAGSALADADDLW